MNRANGFQLPFTTPSEYEAQALAIAALYFRRAANEAQTRRLAFDRTFTQTTALDDLPASLVAASSLCNAVIETTLQSKTFL